MNIEQLEVQMDSAMRSLRKRFRRASSATASSPSSHGQSAPGSLASSPISRHSGRASRGGISLRSQTSMKKLRAKLFGGEGGTGTSGRRGEGMGDTVSTVPSEENLAWTAPVSPQTAPRSGTVTSMPRRRNSARLRELQTLLRAYHEQRETWLSPPASPVPKREKEHQPKKEAGTGKKTNIGYPQMSTAQIRRSPPVPLRYSRSELGSGHPLVFPAFSPQGRRPVVEAQKRISLGQLEMALRGEEVQQKQSRLELPEQVWSSGSASSRSGPSSPVGPSSPELPPIPSKRKDKRRVSISPPARSWRQEKMVLESHYFRAQSPRPTADVHFEEVLKPSKQYQEEEELNKEKKPSPSRRKEQKETVEKPPKQPKSPKERGASGGGTSSMFSPAGLQQLLFRHSRQRRQSEGRGEDAGRKRPLEGFHTPSALPRSLVRPARSEPRLSRSALSGLRPDSLGSSLAALSLSPSTTALEHLLQLRERVTETKYVTSAFESRGGLGPVLEDVKDELEHWLGTGSRLLAVACEVHWSVPERFRSRQLEIQLKECLHAVLRENNRRILGLNAEEEEEKNGHGRHRPRASSRSIPLHIALAKSRTEESCSSETETNAFQGIYRRFYPALLSLQDPATVQAHKGYWTLENLADGRRSPPVPRPARFLYEQVPAQLARKSLVAVNMAVLRLRGDNRDYDADEERGKGNETKTAMTTKKQKKKPLKQTFF